MFAQDYRYPCTGIQGLYGRDVHLFFNIPAFILQPNVVLIVPHVVQAKAGELVMNVAGSALIFSFASFKGILTFSLPVGNRYTYSLDYSTRLHCSLQSHLSLSLKHTTLHKALVLQMSPSSAHRLCLSQSSR